jgi:hypothetical protein
MDLPKTRNASITHKKLSYILFPGSELLVSCDTLKAFAPRQNRSHHTKLNLNNINYTGCPRTRGSN